MRMWRRSATCLSRMSEPRATEHIPEMVAMIATLIEKGHAYAAEGHVLFDVKSWQSGLRRTRNMARLARQLAGRHDRRCQGGGRPLQARPDGFRALEALFARASRDGRAPGALGRPGWHLECSAMSDKWLWQDVEDGALR